MKLDELPPTVIVHILTYLSRREHLGMQTLSKRFYAAVGDAQLLERIRYYTEGYLETAALIRLFGSTLHWHLSRNQFIIGLLYLAHSRKYKLNFHNNLPRAPVYLVGTPWSEFAFSKEI
jgi:hypothetical protein